MSEAKFTCFSGVYLSAIWPGRLAYDAINIDACMFDFQPNNDARTSVASID